MGKNVTELVFVLDRSGSMSGLEQDTIGGFNELLKEQKGLDGEVLVTTVLFDDEYEVLHDRCNIKEIKPITTSEYYVRGLTALLDAIGKTVNRIRNEHVKQGIKEMPNKVMFVITTDGYENASVEFTSKEIKRLIERMRMEHDWEFIFLGANIDAVMTAEKFGIDKNRAANYHADSAGTALNYKTLSRAVKQMRTSASINDDWAKEINEDYTKRKEK